MPKIGIVTPLYCTQKNKRLELFKDTVGSVLAQNYDFSWMIVDDSSPASPEEYVRSLGDKRVVYTRRQKQPWDLNTASNALNHGFKLLSKDSCDAFCFLHSDDMLTRDSLRKREEALKDGMVYGNTLLFSSNSMLSCSGGKDFKGGVEMYTLGFPYHSVMWSKNLVLRMMAKREGEIFDSQLWYGEDLDAILLSFNLAKQEGMPVNHLNEFVYAYRLHDSNISGERRKNWREQRARVLKKHNLTLSCLEDPVCWINLLRRPGF